MDDFSKKSRTFVGTNYVKQKTGLNENGFLLLENILSLSMLCLLTAAICGTVVWALDKARDIEGDLELLRELSYVMERITADADFADKVEIYNDADNEGMRIYYRKSPNEEEKIFYGRAKAPGGNHYRIYAHDEKGPITGDSLLGQVNITKFKANKVSEHIISIELSGISQITKRTYDINTAVYVQGEIINK
ncbi:MAG: hypothetical protein J6O04_09865 [Selenomonadaceae bacterium]|nr:hypothetical protein [Selenomonadaceae bacterium]